MPVYWARKYIAARGFVYSDNIAVSKNIYTWFCTQWNVVMDVPLSSLFVIISGLIVPMVNKEIIYLRLYLFTLRELTKFKLKLILKSPIFFDEKIKIAANKFEPYLALAFGAAEIFAFLELPFARYFESSAYACVPVYFSPLSRNVINYISLWALLRQPRDRLSRYNNRNR